MNDSHPDITDAQLAQLSFLDSIVENIPAMVFVKDASDLRFVRFNRAGEELLGYSRDELIGKNDYDFFPAAEADAFTAHDREVLSSGLMVDIPEEPIVTRHQGTRMLHTKKIPLLGPDGRPQYLLGISEDITEVRGARELLTTAREAAERANRAKSEFLSRMSHELRTPLNVILGYTQLLLSDDVPPPVTAGVQQIHTAGRHLLELINEVLDISRIEAGRLSLSVEPVQVDLIVREVLALITPLATARSVRLSNAPAGGHYVEADRQRLRQVLINLVTNAAKYGAEGGEVLIEVTSVADERVRISISDTGPGISADQIALLFQPFERLGADEGEIEGTGLGLALSKGLTEAMGGRIGVSSEPGSGSTFWIELSASHELAVEADGDAHPPEGSSLSAGDRTILYVEDNESNVRLIEEVIKRRGDATLVAATHGRHALELARSVQPDVILLDLNLPDMHGSVVLQALRSDEITEAIPVIVVSADATGSQHRAVLAAGASAYLTKPIHIPELQVTLDRLLAPPSEAGGDRP